MKPEIIFQEAIENYGGKLDFKSLGDEGISIENLFFKPFRHAIKDKGASYNYPLNNIYIDLIDNEQINALAFDYKNQE